MNLLVNSILPQDGTLNVPIDSDIVVEFDQDIDPFAIISGISIYTQTDQQWIGSELSILDTKHREVMDIGEDYSYIQYAYTVQENTVTITPLTSLLPNRKYYIAVFPGDDVDRYVSAITSSNIAYTRSGTSEGTVEIVSAYSGAESASYSLLFDGLGSFDVIKDGTVLVGSFEYTEGEEVNIGNIKVSVFGLFDDTDTADFDVFEANGVSNIYKTSFTTSEYETATPEQQSVKITTLSGRTSGKIKLVSSVPGNMSINNSRVNPIVLKFSKPVDPNQDLLSLISITKKDMNTSITRSVSYYYKINSNIVKLYLLSLD
jgi:hypothetical protein